MKKTDHPSTSISRSITRLATLALLAVVASGCTTFTPGMKARGYVADSYVSAITAPVAGVSQPCAAIRVAPLAHAAPAWDNGGAGCIPRFFPLISFLATPVTITNQIHDESAATMTLKPGECEQLLAAELVKGGIARDAVTTPESPADFEVRGTMDFVTEWDMHFSGCGSIIYCFTILPLLTPNRTTHLIATAHLELVSLRTGKPALSKDYTQRCHFLVGTIPGNNHRHFTGFGAEVLPPLIREFIQDVHALPADTWASMPK
jgi:hypothetical protein